MKLLKPIIENLGERIAASNGGRISASHLIPYLPVSLRLIEKHLDEMVDHAIVTSCRFDGIKVYEFNELLDAPRVNLQEGICIYSGEPFQGERGKVLCPRIEGELKEELLALAETTAWPADAVWQHELLYIAANISGEIRIADLAGRSRLTLKQVKQKLIELAKVGGVTQVWDEDLETYVYQFPKIEYIANWYRNNDAFIRKHPSSLKDEFEVKLVKALSVLIIIAVACFGFSFFVRVPFVLTILIGGVVSAGAVWKVFTKKQDVLPTPSI